MKVFCKVLSRDIYTSKKIRILIIPTLFTTVLISLSCQQETLKTTPTIVTLDATNITTSTSLSGGTISDDGGALVTSRGICWSTDINPDINDSKTIDGKGIGSFISSITDLKPAERYYARAYAINSIGVSYGNLITFTTASGIYFNPNLIYGTVSDTDGNVYKTIQIGSQTWMAENLKTTKYRNSDLIGTTFPASLDITSQSSPKYQWAYSGNENNVATYGRLYTWYAANDNRQICPEGWRLPSDAEWQTLTTYLGGESIAGGKLKETGTNHWQSPNTGAANTSGFTALPSGNRTLNGTFENAGIKGLWWSSTETSLYNAWSRNMLFNYNYAQGYFYDSKANGFSVRCIKGEIASLPTLTTNTVSNITATTAIIGGTISNDGGSDITDRGVCWSTYQNPTISNSKTTDGSGVGTYTSLLTGLIPGKTYYARAYATNNRMGTAYGNQVSFITSVKDPINRKVYFNTYNPAGNDPCLASCVFDLSQWHYFAATISSTYLVKIYIDGQLVDTGYLYNVNGSVSTINHHEANWYKLYIGASYVYTFDDFYKGFFDEMRISSCERTSAEISTAYSSRKEFLKDNYTLGLWHFENTITNEVTKAIGSKSGDVDYSQGQWGRCLNFGGVNSFVDCNFSNIPEANVTFEFWVKFNESFGAKNIDKCTVIQPYGYLSGNICISK